MLDVHNRSTHQKQDAVQLPARVIDNGMANQFRVESQNHKQMLQDRGEKKGDEDASHGKQEMSKT